MKKIFFVIILLSIANLSFSQLKLSLGYGLTKLTNDEAKDIYDSPKGFDFKGLVGFKDAFYGGIFYDSFKGECNAISVASEDYDGEGGELKYDMKNIGFESNIYIHDNFYLLGRLGSIKWEEKTVGDVRYHKESIKGTIYSLGIGSDVIKNKGWSIFAEAVYNWSDFSKEEMVDVDNPFGHWKFNFGITYRLLKEKN
ncbi:MAG: hypothetical protein KQH79_11385 [Bacteroidetes bacterium]|nr:hypothetical protein [Bacteroidota bacterium]